MVRVTLKGCVTAHDLLALAAESQNYEINVKVVPHRITDMTQIEEMAIHYPDISVLAANRGKIQFPNAFKSAIIACNSHHLGYATMFQTLNTNPQIIIQIFSDEASAIQWIASPVDLTFAKLARQARSSESRV